MQTEMLIGSKFEKGTETEEQILNPKTGETILGLPEASQAQIEAAVAAAEKALRPGRARRRRSAPATCSRSPIASRPRPRSSRRSRR